MISYQGGEGEEKAEMRTNVSWERHLRARRGVGERRKVLTLNGKRSRSRRREREREVKTRKRMSVVGGRNCSHLSSLSSSYSGERNERADVERRAVGKGEKCWLVEKRWWSSPQIPPDKFRAKKEGISLSIPPFF